MKSSMKKRSWLTVVLAVAVCITAGTSVAAVSAAVDTYYICYESNDYRVSAVNALKLKSGTEYTISPSLSRGDKFYISDGKGRLWGNAKGEPYTVTESGRNRYTVTFDPSSAYADGSHIALAFYAPAEYRLSAGGTEQAMTYRRANAVFEEYYAELQAQAGDVVTVTGAAGTYGEFGPDTAGITVPREGKYRFAFTADTEHLYADDAYLIYEEVPSLYLLCDENDHTAAAGYELRRDETAIAYKQYSTRITIPENGYELRYSVLDADSGETYAPSEGGSLNVKDKGVYEALYSPDHIYAASGTKSFHTAVKRVAEFYDGWYVLGDFNGFTFIGGEDFDRDYKLTKDETQKDYDEYALTLYVTEETLRTFDGKVEFYIGDGADIYRKPNGDNIRIERAGAYTLTFSPVHDYGRGYRYKYVRVSDGTTAETVSIGSETEFLEFLENCISPEYSIDKTFLLTRDLDLSGRTVSPALVFAGEFDGMYRRVTGVELKGDNDYTALFKRVTASGAVRRTEFTVEVSSDGRYAALAGENEGLLSELTVNGSVAGDDYAAGIAAANTGKGRIEKCLNRAAVTGILNAGGIAGFNAGVIEDCVNEGAVNRKTFATSDAVTMLNVGGIAGYSTGRIAGARNRAAVGMEQGRYVGGIAGLSSGGVYLCDNEGAVAGETYAGGIVGYYGRFDSKTGSDLGDYLTGGNYEAWLDKYFGSNDGSFEEAADSGVHEMYYCVNAGAVKAENYAGGIAGHAGASGLTVTACVSVGNITAHTAYAGGIVGEAGESTLSECLSYGDILAVKGAHAGGIAGLSAGTIEYCQSSAYAEAVSYAGGIAGEGAVIRGSIANVYINGGSGDHFGSIAGAAPAASCAYNYYVENGTGGIDGVRYGAASSYAACALPAEAIMSAGMLSPELIGFSSDHWLAGESEPRYPVPRAFTDMARPNDYPDTAAYDALFARNAAAYGAISDSGGRVIVTVTFFAYDFDAETYDRLVSYRLRKGEGLDAAQIPAPPQREGYFVWWDTSDFSAVTANLEVKEMYDKALTTLASDGGARPEVLAEGVFYSDTVLALVRNGAYTTLRFTRGDREIDCGDVIVKYRTDNPHAVVKLVRGGEIVEAETRSTGEYICFTLPAGWGFAVETAAENLFALWVSLAAVGGALVAAAAFAVPLFVRSKRKRGAAASDTDGTSDDTDSEH